MTVEAGKLNKRIVIQRPGMDRDELGQLIPAWQDVPPPCWASILHRSGLETIKADTSISVVKASIRIRYRLDIDATMRVLHKSVVYEIKAVLPDEVGHEYVDLVCETGASNG